MNCRSASSPTGQRVVTSGSAPAIEKGPASRALLEHQARLRSQTRRRICLISSEERRNPFCPGSRFCKTRIRRGASFGILGRNLGPETFLGQHRPALSSTVLSDSSDCSRSRHPPRHADICVLPPQKITVIQASHSTTVMTPSFSLHL
jgi:hypothetical protein